MDDTGARHQGKNGICTQIGNDGFTFFGITFSKSRANFLGLLRAGYGDYVLNDQAFAYMHRRSRDAFLRIGAITGTPVPNLPDRPGFCPGYPSTALTYWNVSNPTPKV